MNMSRSRLASTVALSAALALGACAAPGSGTKESASQAGGAAAECSPVQLRLSHQWPDAADENGDFRALVAQKFAEQVEKATDGKVTTKVYPNSTLSKATEQYDAMMNGSIDMSVLPLDYASGRVPSWSITLMPGLVRSHEAAKAWDEGEIGAAVKENMSKNGLVLLTHVWNAGGIGIQGDPVLKPSDVKAGTTWRAAGTYVEHMLEDAGAGITSMGSSEIYTALQTGVLDAAVTSASSFSSYHLQEQVKSYTSPTANTFWFMYEPLVITNSSFAKLCAEQQDAVKKVGADLQEFAYTASKADDAKTEKIFADAGVKVAHMSDADFDAWLPLAEKQWDHYAKNVAGGQELMDLARKQQSK